MRVGIAALVLVAVTLTGCSTTGRSFDSAGLNHIVEGRTTLAQASEYLRATPVDTWRRNDGSVLARWAYKGTAVTDALYFRQEAWLLFAADGTFERTENAINLPLMNRTRTQAEADRMAAEQTWRDAAASGRVERAESPVIANDPMQATPALGQAGGTDGAQALPVEPQASLPIASSGNALWPAGTIYTPGVSYPISQQK